MRLPGHSLDDAPLSVSEAATACGRPDRQGQATVDDAAQPHEGRAMSATSRRPGIGANLD
jgi:hypothetical protein